MLPLDVIVVGSFVQDHAWLTEVFPQDGETRVANGFSTGAGGKGFNQAIACQRQGVKTCFLGAIGADALGENAQRFAIADGLLAEWDVRSDAPTAASSILVDARGENRIVVALGANERLDGAFVAQRRKLISAAKVVLTQVETGLSASREALAIARQQNLVGILNPAPINAGLDQALFGLADIVTPNETEFAFLLEHLFGTTLPPRYWESGDELLHQLCRKTGARTVVLTLGKQGCFVSHADARTRKDADRWYRVAAEPAKVIDTTGAGDAFSGGLAAGMILYHYDQPFQRAVVHANRVAAMSTEMVGTAPAMPTRKQVEARFGS